MKRYPVEKQRELAQQYLNLRKEGLSTEKAALTINDPSLMSLKDWSKRHFPDQVGGRAKPKKDVVRRERATPKMVTIPLDTQTVFDDNKRRMAMSLLLNVEQLTHSIRQLLEG